MGKAEEGLNFICLYSGLCKCSNWLGGFSVRKKRRKKSLPKDPKRVQSLGRFCRLDTGQVGMEKQVYALE